jgi:hypothetical protein
MIDKKTGKHINKPQPPKIYRDIIIKESAFLDAIEPPMDNIQEDDLVEVEPIIFAKSIPIEEIQLKDNVIEELTIEPVKQKKKKKSRK